MKKLIYLLLFFFPISACQNKEGAKLPNEVRWVTQSSEYSSVCEQIYNSASLVLQNQFEGVDRPVIVMDLDETVLNNVQYQVELFEKSETYNPTSWNAWVNKELATAVPGAKSFSNLAKVFTLSPPRGKNPVKVVDNVGLNASFPGKYTNNAHITIIKSDPTRL